MVTLLVLATAAAADPSVTGDAAVETVTLSWQLAGFVPGAEDEQAAGPDLLAAGPEGLLAYHDPEGRRVVILRELEPAGEISVDRADDLAFTAAGRVLILDDAARTLILSDISGSWLDTMALPGTTPLGGRLMVTGAEVRSADAFGNLHRLARVDSGVLSVGTGPLLISNPRPIVWDQRSHSMSVDGDSFLLPDALKAGGRLAGAWLCVDSVVSDRPITVARSFYQLGSSSVTIGVKLDGRPYAPLRDFAGGDDGRLWLLLPEPAGLTIARVTP